MDDKIKLSMKNDSQILMLSGSSRCERDEGVIRVEGEVVGGIDQVFHVLMNFQEHYIMPEGNYMDGAIKDSEVNTTERKD